MRGLRRGNRLLCLGHLALQLSDLLFQCQNLCFVRLLHVLKLLKHQQSNNNNVLFYVLSFLQSVAHSPLQSEEENTVKLPGARARARTHRHRHTDTDTHTHTHTHTHTEAVDRRAHATRLRCGRWVLFHRICSVSRLRALKILKHQQNLTAVESRVLRLG